MNRNDAWRTLAKWSEQFDGSRDLSDEANEWADDEASHVEPPDGLGEWKASMATAFEAGRMYERILTGRDRL
jgi:hypothetical protein